MPLQIEARKDLRHSRGADVLVAVEPHHEAFQERLHSDLQKTTQPRTKEPAINDAMRVPMSITPRS